MFGKGDVEGVFLSKRDVGRLQTAGVAWAIEERGDHRVLSEASGTLDNSKGISRLRFWCKNSRVNGINDLPVFMHQGIVVPDLVL